MQTLIVLRYELMAATQRLRDSFTESDSPGERLTLDLPSKIGARWSPSSTSLSRMDQQSQSPRYGTNNIKARLLAIGFQTDSPFWFR
jgi:hypothetical protein